MNTQIMIGVRHQWLVMSLKQRQTDTSLLDRKTPRHPTGLGQRAVTWVWQISGSRCWIAEIWKTEEYIELCESRVLCFRYLLSVIYCSITNDPKTQWLRTNSSQLYSQSPWVRNSRVFRQGGSGSGHTWGHRQDVSWGRCHLKAWPGAGIPASKVGHSHGS